MWASRTSGMPENRVVSRSGSMNQKSEGKSIPRDTILPVLMISLCCFNTTVFWQNKFEIFHTLRLSSRRFDYCNISRRGRCQWLNRTPGLQHHGGCGICPFLQGVPRMELSDGYRCGPISRRFVSGSSHKSPSKWFR